MPQLLTKEKDGSYVIEVAVRNNTQFLSRNDLLLQASLRSTQPGAHTRMLRATCLAGNSGSEFKKRILEEIKPLFASYPRRYVHLGLIDDWPTRALDALIDLATDGLINISCSTTNRVLSDYIVSATRTCSIFRMATLLTQDPATWELARQNLRKPPSERPSYGWLFAVPVCLALRTVAWSMTGHFKVFGLNDKFELPNKAIQETFFSKGYKTTLNNPSTVDRGYFVGTGNDYISFVPVYSAGFNDNNPCLLRKDID